MRRTQQRKETKPGKLFGHLLIPRYIQLSGRIFSERESFETPQFESGNTEWEMDVDETEPERSTVDAPGSKDKEDPKSSSNIPEEQPVDMVVGNRIPGRTTITEMLESLEQWQLSRQGGAMSGVEKENEKTARLE